MPVLGELNKVPILGIERRGLYLVESNMRNSIPTPEAWRGLLNDWIGWQRAACVPVTTTKLRSYHLRRFAVLSGLEPFEVDVHDLIAHLSAPGWSPGTRRSVRTSLRAFYSWARALELIETNPSDLLPTVTAPVGKPRPASDSVLAVGLSATDERVRLMIELGARAGLRCCEIAVVSTSDIQGEAGRRSLLVHGKGGKERYVPISDELAEEILERPAGFAFPGQIDGHLSAAYVSKMMSRALGHGGTAHPLRHRFATRALRSSGGNLRIVQELLGHASVATTQIYTQVDDDELRAAALSAYLPHIAMNAAGLALASASQLCDTWIPMAV